MKKTILTMLLSLVAFMPAFAQLTVKGTVVDMSGEPLPGVSIAVVGTSHGTMTDFDGTYSVSNVAPNATLRYSFVGMVTQEIKVDGRSTIDVVLKDDNQALDEVVVIGYGAAKAKDLTAPITVVKGEDLAAIPTSSPMGALTGKVPGVNILNSGTPGDAPKVQIRGIGSFSAANPLYVVDGVFYDNIQFLNNDDIEEMSILKDASAAAIYGVKAANGVVIITTKKGKKHQNAKVTYNGYVGVQKATNVLKMCNSAEYATMLLEASPDAYSSMLEASVAQFGGHVGSIPYTVGPNGEQILNNNWVCDWQFGADTDWYKELLRDAVITNHSLSVSGGSDNATYSVGMSYLYQNGIMKAENNYNKLNFRAQLEYDATNWLKVGFNGVFGKSNQRVPFNGTWQQAFNMSSIMPVYDKNNTAAFPEDFATPVSLGYLTNMYNPVASATYLNSSNENYQALTNFFADFVFIPGKLDLRTSYGYDFSQIRSRVVTEPYFVGTSQHADNSSISKTTSTYNKWVWDNVLTYKDNWGDHNFGAMVGYSMRQDRYDFLNGTGTDIPTDKPEYWYIDLGNPETTRATDGGSRYRSQSVFARLNYGYNDRYLVMFTMRADGTSKYQEKWGYFPSVGGAWVISNEPFFQGQTWADFLKLRASWGRLGNDGVPASDGFASISTGNGYSGVFGNNIVNGYQNNSYFSWLKWEVVSETNAGIQFSTLAGRLNLDLDYFYRLTDNAVISPLLPFSNTALAGNYGKIVNSGIDMTLNWSDRVGDFHYNIGFNLSTLRNRVKELSGHPYVLGGQTINMVGKPMNSYYGYKVVGVFQTPEQINEKVMDPDGNEQFKYPWAVENGLEPGDFIYEDVNGDGNITGDDRQCLGNYLPRLSYGLNFSFSWKGLDFSLATYGQHGAKIFNRKRQLRYAQANYNFDHNQYENRWHGAGTTNEYPSAKALTKSWNVSSSATSANSYFVESADFFRIQNITLGYTFRNIKMGAYTLPGLRLSITADRPASFFTANAFSPEISDPQGWDTEVYPLSSTYTFGVQIDF